MIYLPVIPFLKLIFSLNQLLLLGKASQLLGNANSAFPIKFLGSNDFLSMIKGQQLVLLSPHRHNTPDTIPTYFYWYFYTTAVVQAPRGHKFPQIWQQKWPNRMDRKRIQGSVCCQWVWASMGFAGSSLFCFYVILLIKQFQWFSLQMQRSGVEEGWLSVGSLSLSSPCSAGGRQLG